MVRSATIIALIFLTIACAPVERDGEFVSKAPAAKPLGKAQKCILASRITSTSVYDDRTIDFRLTGGKIYRNTLPHSCPRLGFERSIIYEVRGAQLCSPQLVYVRDNNVRRLNSGPGCSLGDFMPIDYVGKGGDQKKGSY